MKNSDILHNYIDAEDYRKAIQCLHITPSTDGYEVVRLHANRISDHNHLALIQMIDGDEEFNMTGGLLVEDTSEIREILDAIPNKMQYKFVLKFRTEPYAQLYLHGH